MNSEWPREMLIFVEERDRSLLELLFVRSAWGLLPDEPALDPSPDPGASARPVTPDQQTWEARWREAWALAWASQFTDQPSEPAQIGRRSPSWMDQFGEDGIDTDALARWVDHFVPDIRAPLESRPERRNGAALKSAWESGLDTIIVLPYRDAYAERVTDRHLVVSAAVRNDPVRYAEALQLRAT
jgi:hypothetical protein